MKVIVLLALSLMLLACQHGDERKTYQLPFEDEALFGEIASLERTKYTFWRDRASGLQVVRDSTFWEYFFSPRQQLVRVIEYGLPQHRDTLSDIAYYRYYDRVQRAVYRRRDEYSAGTGVLDSAARTYTFLHDNGWKQVIRYDNRWELLSDTRYDVRGGEWEKKLYRYDAKGSLVMVSTPVTPSGSWGQLLDTYRYVGNMTEHKHYQGCSDPKDVERSTLRLHTRYYRQGADSMVVTRRHGETTVDSVCYRRGRVYYAAQNDTYDGSCQQDFYEYNGDGKLTQHQRTKTLRGSTERVAFTKTSTYNEIGDLVQEDGIFADLPNEYYRFEYRYDDHHNWTDKKIFYNNRISFHEKRRIHYVAQAR